MDSTKKKTAISGIRIDTAISLCLKIISFTAYGSNLIVYSLKKWVQYKQGYYCLPS